MNQDSKPPVTLEDLLRLKRAERPPAGFWQRFDTELRTKQLAALVNKQPWWNRIPQSFTSFARYRLPLGATAALALTLVTVREYRSDERAVLPDQITPTRTLEPIVSGGSLKIESAMPALAEAVVLPVYDVRDSNPAPAPDESAQLQRSTVSGLSNMVSLLDGMSDSRSSDLISANLAATQAV